MMFGLVNVSLSLPEWQAVKMTFFAPCYLEFIELSGLFEAWVKGTSYFGW